MNMFCLERHNILIENIPTANKSSFFDAINCFKHSAVFFSLNTANKRSASNPMIYTQSINAGKFMPAGAPTTISSC